MKDFFKMLLAVICGLLLFFFITIFIAGGALSAMGAAASGDKKAVLPRSGVLAVDMSAFVLEEQTTLNNISLNTATIPAVGILQAVKAIGIAAQDPGVKGIFLKTDGNTSSIAAVEEFRKAIADFRKSGKPVIAYIENPSTAGYWLASAADKVYMTEYQGSTITMNGVSIQTVFLKDLLDKLGVNVQLIRHGKFKSAGEMFTRNGASPENTLQYKTMVDSFWSVIRKDIAEARGLTEEAVDAVIDNLELCCPEDFLTTHMADDILTRQELKEKISAMAMKENFENVGFMRLADYAAVKVLPNFKAKNKIAVIYAAGDIVDGNGFQGIAGDRFAGIIDKVRNDDNVKAVVLRVNSGGGSVLASEKIKHELDLLGEEKPLVASFGDYAASGGYWISNNCNIIYSDATTLTGSIGVFAMIPDFGQTARKVLGVNVQSISSNRHGDLMGLMRPLDSSEYNYLLKSIEAVYDKFITTVSEGREIDKEKVDDMGQGRVWTGSDALGLGLVDEIGTLADAIDYAVVAAGFNAEEVQIAEYPAPLTTFQQMMMMVNGTPDEGEFVKAQVLKMSRPQVIARMPYEITVLN